jgi:hypothetical protein
MQSHFFIYMLFVSYAIFPRSDSTGLLEAQDHEESLLRFVQYNRTRSPSLLIQHFMSDFDMLPQT